VDCDVDPGGQMIQPLRFTFHRRSVVARLLAAGRHGRQRFPKVSAVESIIPALWSWSRNNVFDEGKEHREASSSASTPEQLKKRKRPLRLFFVGLNCALPFLQLSQPSERTFNFQEQMLLCGLSALLAC
jgi:hypothetical protein